MEANSKLQKKKRIAHSHMSKSNFEGPNLPTDDFLFNIMKDMDSQNIMSSYQLSQDAKSKIRQETSKNNSPNLKSSNLDSYCKKQEGKYLPKKLHPLMQKCRTSLKNLKKNRCIPKPRAHVGSIPKPPKQHATFAEPSISNSNTEKSKDGVRRTKIQSKAYSQVMESNSKRDSNINLEPNKTTEKDSMINRDKNDSDCSNSDDDAAYENFIKRTKEEDKIASDSDSDSRLTIRRKKSKSKQRGKKFKGQSTSYNNKYISKVTSIPLSDSSNSQSEEAFEVNEKLKRRKVLSARSRKQVPTDPLESFQSDSSLDELPDLSTNNGLSEDDSCVETAASENTKSADFIDNSMPAMENSAAEVPSFKSFSKATHQQSDKNLASIPFDSITLVNPPRIDKILDISKSDSLISSVSMSVQKYQVPCCVRLKRDPIIEQKAETYISAKNYSAVDCINISDESDNEASTTLPSNDSPSYSSDTHRNTGIQNSDSNTSEEIDDCLIMCELPKVESSKLLNPESMHSSTKSISIDLKATHKQPPVDKDLTSTEINCEQSPNSDGTATNVSCERTSKSTEEFKVQIVAVKSLVEQSQNSLIVTAEENEIEIVDLSDDDDLNSQQNDGANQNFEAVKQMDAELYTKEEIHPNVKDIPFIPNDQNRDSQILLSNDINQSHCEEAPVQVKEFSNSKILEVLNKIDFDSIKEIINKTGLINSESSIAQEIMKNKEQNSESNPIPEQIAVIDSKATTDNGKNECTINDKKRKDIAIYNPVLKKPKCEMFESPSDELDVIAASFTKDLGTPNKKVDALLNLYRAEYAKYMNIVNTEANVTLGLKMLHNKQWEKLTHLRSSIKNLVKHDPCFHTAIQEKFDSKAQTFIKNEEKLKQNILIPTSYSERNDVSVHAKTDTEIRHSSSVKESGSEIPTHPKLEGKLKNSEDCLAKPITISEVKERTSVVTTPREKFLKYMENLKCAECGEPATARCQGCAQVFYCSSQCGVLSWKKGHNLACRRRI